MLIKHVYVIVNINININIKNMLTLKTSKIAQKV